MNGTTTKHSDVDETLSRYFKSQLPNPWPRWQAPEDRASLPRRRTPWLSVSRWAVAASLGALLAAYLAIAGYFPREKSGGLDVDQRQNFGQKMRPKTPPQQP